MIPRYAAGAALAAALLLAPAAQAAEAEVMTRAAQQAMTPEAALQRLLDGNARYVAGETRTRDLAAQRAATAGGQFPFASVLSCLDSRVAPELLFDQGLGDLFVGRVAGNFVDPEMLGSFEFASKVAGARVLVVLGHTDCGAVKGACDGVELGNLTDTLAQIQPAVEAVGGDFSPRDSSNPAYVAAVTRKNVELTVAEIRRESPILREMEEAGELRIVGAIYDLASGRVTLLR